MAEQEQGDYIIEFIRLGQAMKVIAIDPVSLREVSIVGNPKESRQHLAKVAVEKLRYVLEKERNG